MTRLIAFGYAGSIINRIAWLGVCLPVWQSASVTNIAKLKPIGRQFLTRSPTLVVIPFPWF